MFEYIGVRADDLACDVDLLQLNPGCAQLHRLHVDIDRPELGADHSRSQAGDVGVAGGGPSQIVRTHALGLILLSTDGPRKIIVAVEEGGLRKDPSHPFEVFVLLRTGGGRGHQGQNQEEAGASGTDLHATPGRNRRAIPRRSECP